MDEIIDTFTPKFAEVSRHEVAVLMPVHNEADTIERVVIGFFNEIARRIALEVICCEDGSTDGTKERLRGLGQRMPMKIVLGANRKGYSTAIRDGLKLVSSKYVLFVDSDEQYTPRDFWKLYELRDEYDIVSGRRIKRADPSHRSIMSSLFQWMTRRFFKLPPIQDMTSPYRLVRTDVAKRISRENKYMKESFWTEFTIRSCCRGYKMVEIPVAHKASARGSTRVYTPLAIPSIVLRQIQAMIMLWLELGARRHVTAPLPTESLARGIVEPS